MQQPGSPTAETYSYRRLHTISKSDDDIEIIMKHLVSLSFALNSTMLSGCSEFPNYHFFI